MELQLILGTKTIPRMGLNRAARRAGRKPGTFDVKQESTMTPAKMHAEAIEHSCRYLLPRRHRRGDPKLDRLYEVAQELVDSGHASWIKYPSNFAPGIRLTTKPFQS